eukprot:1183495-Prorocentrum_minimum.AAC.3
MEIKPRVWMLRANCVDVKGNSVDVKGNSVDVKGNSVDVKGNSVDVKGNSVDLSAIHVHATSAVKRTASWTMPCVWVTMLMELFRLCPPLGQGTSMSHQMTPPSCTPLLLLGGLEPLPSTLFGLLGVQDPTSETTMWYATPPQVGGRQTAGHEDTREHRSFNIDRTARLEDGRRLPMRTHANTALSISTAPLGWRTAGGWP